MTDLNDLWEKGKPVAPGSVVRVPQQPAPTQQPSNSGNATPADQQWDASRPVNVDIGDKHNPTPAPDATSIPAHDPTWTEAAAAMIPGSKRWRESAVKTGQEIVEGASKAAHAVISDPLGVGEKILKTTGENLEKLTNPSKLAASVLGPWIDPENKKAMSQGLPGYIRDQLGWSTPEEKAKVVADDPMSSMVFNRYGDLDKIKKTMYEDPFGAWMDIATVASGGEGAALRAGMTNTARGLGVAARMDPISLAMRGIPELRVPGVEAIASHTVPRTLGWRSGVGPETITEIRDLHKPGTPVFERYGETGPREFNDAFTGNVTAKEVVDRAELGARRMRQDAGTGYRLDKSQWAQQGGTFDFSGIDAAEQNLRQSLHTPGGIDVLDPPERRRVQRMFQTIDQLRTRGPGGWTAEELDGLKKRVQNMVSGPLDHPQIKRASMEMKSAIQQQIEANAPGNYREAMSRYHSAMDDLDEMRSALSLGKGASDHTVMSKLQSILRNNASTQYGARGALVDLLEREGNVNLRPWLLGMATNVDAPRGIAGAMRAASSAPSIVGGGAGYMALGPAGLALAPIASAADMVAHSPRLSARTARGMGRHGDDWSEAFPLLRYPAIQGDREHNATGGRVGYAEGGEVDVAPMPVQRAAVDEMLGLSTLDPFTTGLQKPGRIGASRAIYGPTMREPAPPSMPTPTAQPQQDPLGQLANIVKQAGEDDVKAKEAAEKKAELEAEKEKLRIAATARATASGAGGSGTGSVTYDQTFGLPEATPLPGGSYEDKVRAGESGGNDAAVNKTTGAAGRYQFMPSTAEGLIKANPNAGISANWRTNPDDQAKLMKLYTDQSRAALQKMGLESSGGRLYMMHLFGQGGGQRVLSQLDKPIKEITTEAERAANPFLNQFLTGKDLLNYFERRFG